MKEIRDLIRRTLPPLKVYEDEVRELDTFLRANCKGVSLQIGGFELDSVDEIAKLPEREYHELVVICDGPHLRVYLDASSAKIFCGDTSVVSEGMVSRAEQILRKGELRMMRITAKWWILSALTFVLGFLCAVLNNIYWRASAVVLIVLVLGRAFWEAYSYTRRYCTIVMSTRKDAGGFWHRKKDEVILGVVIAIASTAVGVIGTLLTTWALGLLHKSPGP
jgi:hypothetical protein